MILYKLVCANEHSFESWFKDGAACDSLLTAHALSCPICDDKVIKKALMTPSIGRKGALSERTKETGNTKILQEALSALRREVEAKGDYVGDDFPEEARKIHYGESEQRLIYGEATIEEAHALQEEGIKTLPLPSLRKTDA